MLIALMKNDSKSDVTLQQKLRGLLRHSPGTGTLQSNPGMKLHFVEQNVLRVVFAGGLMLVFERAERRSSMQSSTHTICVQLPVWTYLKFRKTAFLSTFL